MLDSPLLLYLYKMRKIHLEPEENSFYILLKTAILKRCLPLFYFHGLRAEMMPYVIEGLMVLSSQRDSM